MHTRSRTHTHTAHRPAGSTAPTWCLGGVGGDHTEHGAYLDVSDLRAAATPASVLVMDDISVGPGCVLRRLARAGALEVAETYGPFDAPSPYNPCMRGKGHRAATCAPWGFAVARYTPRALGDAPEAWPPRKKRTFPPRKCWADGQMWI